MADAPASRASGDAQKSNVPEYSVSELSYALKRTVEETYGYVRVRGELGRVLVAKSGHLYTDLKDEKAVIDGVMWKTGVGRLNFKPEEGLEVIVEGKLSTYPGRSKYQIIIERMAPAGAGALMALLEERKKKLAAEGLFDAERKVKLPYLPEVVGVVTSPTGAVIRDILHRIADRFPRHVLLWPVLVQGEQAAGQIAEAIAGFNALKPGGPVPRPDVLIVARGGGSIEDLWAFNEEVVVRAAAASDIPLVSAVGHETDTTLIDYAADVRAPTPTGAAEMVVPVRAELAARIDTIQGRLGAAMTRALERRRVDVRAATRGLPRTDDLIGSRAQRLDAAGQGLRAALKGLADAAAVRFSRVAGRLRAEALARDLELKRRRLGELASRGAAQSGRAVAQARQRTDEAGRRLERAGARLLAHQAQRLQAHGGRLESVNPKAVLGRGYALVHREAGGLARRAGDLTSGEAVALEFADGRRGAVIAEDAGPGGSSGGAKRSRRKGSGHDRGAKADAGPKTDTGQDTGQGALF